MVERRLTMSDIRSRHRASGGPFFSNCKASGVKFIGGPYQGIGGIFFVTHESPDEKTCWPVFNVWQYVQDTQSIRYIGKSTGNDYKATLESARTWAKLKAGGTVKV